MTPEDLLEYVDGIVHEDTQLREDGLDLTVAAIYGIDAPGRVDFGGGELDEATVSSARTNLRDPDDDYGWWELESGTYLLEYNETLATDEPHRLQPGRALLERGATHPTLFVRELHRVPLSVAPGGLLLKENARVSTLLAQP